MNDQLLYQIGITKIPMVGAILAKNLISYCGGAQAVFESSKKSLIKIPGIGNKIAEHIIKQRVLSEAAAEIQFLERNKIQPFFFLDDAYPNRLKQLYDCPIMLYYRGTADLNQKRIVSVVGTRKPSRQGISLCEELIEGLKAFDVLVVSGLAYGIDITAHRSCLKEGVDTIGVLGHGLQTIYPSHHHSTARKMVEQGGLLTEYAGNTAVDPNHFPMRNRIIAGMCDALVVVETARKGGSMISAEMANAYNKDVFAFPGRIKDEYSQGCNYLIKSHKAALIEEAADLAGVMRWEELDARKSIQKQLFIELDEGEQKIVDLFKDTAEISIDQLTISSGLTSSFIASLLLQLEFKGVIRSLPGKRYALV